MTPRERADEVMDVTWGGWGSGDPWQQVPAFVTHRDRIEAAIIAATEDAETRAEAAEKALEEMTKVAKAMAGNYGQDGGP